MLGSYAEAESCATAASDLAPDQPRAWVNRGFARLKGGLPGAVEDLEAAVAKGDGKEP
jgi:regulator of sirC expression with transglutaminase-like and TPR domain